MSKTILYRLLLFTNKRDYNITEAKFNYNKIMKKVHPDKNNSARAKTASQHVIIAYNILKDVSQRSLYNRYGLEDFDESTYDQEGFEETVEYLRQLLAEDEEPETITITDDDEPQEESAPRRSKERQTKERQTSNMPQTSNQEETSDINSRDETMEENLSFKQTLDAILSHSNRYGNLGFTVEWGPCSVVSWEKLENILDHKETIKQYLSELKVKSPKGHASLFKHNPKLIRLYM